MYQLTRNQFSRLPVKLGFSKSNICLFKNGNITRLNSCLKKLNFLSIRSVSITSVRFLKKKDDPKEKMEDDSKGPVLKGKLEEDATVGSVTKNFINTYGKLGFYVYISVSLATIAIMYMLLSWGVDVAKIAEFFKIGEKLSKKIEQHEVGSKFAVAYLISKLLLPLRLMIATTIVAIVRRKFLYKIP